MIMQGCALHDLSCPKSVCSQHCMLLTIKTYQQEDASNSA